VANQVEFHPSAAAEFEAAVDWYLARSERVAGRFVDEVDRALGLISDSPRRWPMYQEGVRKFVLRRFPFVIVYIESPELVRIVAVAHGHRRPYYWKSRL
jgi:plasmid stabilization system protein ParE